MANHSRFAALTPAKAPTGRPSSYAADYCWRVREPGQEGKFPEQSVAELGVTLSTMYRWADKHSDFEQALHEAHWLCKAHWADQAQRSVQGVGMPPSILAMILERRFPNFWSKNAPDMHEHFLQRKECSAEEQQAQDLSKTRRRHQRDDSRRA